MAKTSEHAIRITRMGNHMCDQWEIVRFSDNLMGHKYNSIIVL